MRKQGIEYRAVRVSMVTGLSTFLSVAFQLVSVPVCLHYWGQTTYGHWLALFAAFQLIRSLDAHSSSTTRRAMTALDLALSSGEYLVQH